MRGFLDDYCKILSSYDLITVQNLFSKDCSFIGNTTGLDPKLSTNDICDYFRQWRDKGIRGDFTIKTLYVRPIDSLLLCFGAWSIKVGEWDLPSRFTFVIKRTDRSWSIIHKHSSYAKVVYPWNIE